MPFRPSPVAVYTVQRLALFVVVTLVLSLTGLRGFPLLALALVVSGLISLVLLQRSRGDVSARLVARREARAAGPDGTGTGAAPDRPRGLRGLGRRLDEGAASEDED